MIGHDRSSWTIRNVAMSRRRASGDRIFVQEVDGAAESYRDFIDRGATMARVLSDLGIGRGDRVAIFCQNGLPGLHAWLATALIGAVELPINPLSRGDILRHVLQVGTPAVIVADQDLLPAVVEIRGQLPFVRDLIVVGGRSSHPAGAPGWNVRRHAYEDIIAQAAAGLPDATVRPPDIGSVMFTSGTTGPSKGVMMPNAQLCLLALQCIEAARMTADDVFYCVHPMNHIAGKYMGVFATFATGGRLVLDRRFDAEHWLERVRRHGATLSIAHGPMVEMIHRMPPTPHDHDHDIRRLMCCPLPHRIATAFEERFALRGIEMWGMTEVACPAWTSLDGPRVPRSCGRILTEWYEVLIVDPETDEVMPPGMLGEIVVRPRRPWTTMQGYLGMPAETVEAWRNLWFHTGDAGRMDEEGNMFFVDRIKDRIRRRAENISSYDIEAVANRYPGVRETAVVGVPSSFEGDDDIKLCIVPAAGAEIAPLALLTFLAAELPHSMVPRYIETLHALPRTPTNKVRKRELRESGITTRTWDRHAAGVNLRGLYDSARRGERS